MSEPMRIPSLDEFMAAPLADLARVAPETAIFAPGGTRRSAVLAGISPQSEEYTQWSRQQMVECVQRFFRVGIKHLIVNVLWPAQMAEVGRYRDRLISWLEWGLAGEEAQAAYAAYGWRVRLLGVESLPEISATAERLVTVTPTKASHTLWFYVNASPGAHWQALLAAAQRANATTQEEAIIALYGEAVPLATLYISFGKPIVTADSVPLLTAGVMQAYWTQIPGFAIDEQAIRRILYDYAYMRRTWQQDKSTRYATIPQQAAIWQREPPLILGLGSQLAGGFWYPLAQDEL